MKHILTLLILFCAPTFGDNLPDEYSYLSSDVLVAFSPDNNTYIGQIIPGHREPDIQARFLSYPVNGETAYLWVYTEGGQDQNLFTYEPIPERFWYPDSGCTATYGTFTNRFYPDNFGNSYIWREGQVYVSTSFYQLDLTSPTDPTQTYYQLDSTGNCTLYTPTSGDPQWAVFYPVLDIIPYDTYPYTKHYLAAYITEVVYDDDTEVDTEVTDDVPNAAGGRMDLEENVR